MLSKYPISQIVRKFLDKSLSEKGLIFWVFAPFLFFVSFVVAKIAHQRRKIGYRKFNDLSIIAPKNLTVICIGNVVLGGTGKSPIVRKFASEYLKKNCIVAIAARGINTVCVSSVNSLNFTNAQLALLSDENREHFEILKHEFSEKQFFIFQNPNRLESLYQYVQFIAGIPDLQCVFILDDGLQHFSCPRNFNICICDERIQQVAPQYAWPVGPYREGFGVQSMNHLVNSFDLRIWKTDSFKGKNVFDFCENHQTYHGVRDIFAKYSLKFMEIKIFENQTFSFDYIIPNLITQRHQSNHTLLLIAGIAHPDRFFSDISDIIKHFNIYEKSILADHGHITEDLLGKIRHFDVIIMTAKDFFRFCNNQYFLALCKDKNVYVCHTEYILTQP